MDEEELPESVKVVDTDLYDVSSTQIRETIRNGESAEEWLEKGVSAYIEKYGLYKC